MPDSPGKDSTRSVYNCIHVEYKFVRLTIDAYEALAGRKREEESFSETVERLAADRPLTDLAGVFSDADVEAIRDARAEQYGAYADDRADRWEE